MSAARKEVLLSIAHTYYPPGTSSEEHPPESLRWEEAWDRALEWEECDRLIQAMQAAFPLHRAVRFMQPRKAACVYCILLQESRAPDDGRHLTRIVGAVSILAPLYLIYVTTETIGASQHSPRPPISFVPEGAQKADANTLAQLIEHYLGYRPFPLELAGVPLPGLRVDFLHSEPPTLLTALFANRLDNLP